MQEEYRKSLVNVVFYLGVIVGAYILVPKCLVFFMPFVLGWIIAVLANPLVRFLEKRMKILRKHGSMLIILVSIGVICIGGYFLLAWLFQLILGLVEMIPSLYEALVQDLEDVGKNTETLLKFLPKGIRENFEHMSLNFSTYAESVINLIGEPTASVAGTIVKNVPNAFVHVLFTILSSYFFIAERDRLVEVINKIIPKSICEKWNFIKQSFKQAVVGYFEAQFKIMGVIAVVLFIGFLVLDVKYAIVWAVVISFLDFLPVFGTGSVLWPWTALKLLSGDYHFAIGLLLIYGISQVLHHLLQPKLVGDSVGMNPFFTLLLLFVGYKVNGLLGMIISIPIGMIFLNLYQMGAFKEILDDIKLLTKGFNNYRRRK